MLNLTINRVKFKQRALTTHMGSERDRNRNAFRLAVNQASTYRMHVTKAYQQRLRGSLRHVMPLYNEHPLFTVYANKSHVIGDEISVLLQKSFPEK
ncbi:hypothetical protein SFRURICE_021298 [Spodoptera frugiperda]|nr:hypothetical protein SFRURICE_021298 [Spodoptera frugiperda]